MVAHGLLYAPLIRFPCIAISLVVFHLLIFASLFNTAHCPLLTPRVGFHLRQYIQTLGMIHSVIINLPISFLKTSTVPTYQGISIAFPRYISMQHPRLRDLIVMSYMFLLHWQSIRSEEH